MRKLAYLFFISLLTIVCKAQNPADVAQNYGFNPGFNNAVSSIVLQNDGKILVGGWFTSYSGTTEYNIIRLNTDGTKDISFNTGTGFNQGVMSIALQPDGKILVGGAFSTYNGITENRIVRLNTDGTKDLSFNTGTGFNNEVQSICIQGNGKILVGGSFTSFNGVTENRIVRLNVDGTKDTSFNSGTGFNNRAITINEQSDGKILIGGFFTSYNDTTENKIVRLNTDGTKDNTFNSGTGFNGGQVWTIVKQSDGKFLVGGGFTSYKETTENRIIRLNTDGTKDISFNSGTGFNLLAVSINIEASGKILVGGGFDSYNGATENRIIRLNTDGTKDATFNSGTGFNNEVHTIAVQTDGKIILGGIFTTYNGSSTSAYLITLYGDSLILSNDSFSNTANISLWPNPTKEILNVNSLNNDEISSVKIYDLHGKLIIETSNNTINVSALTAGMYIVKIKSEVGEFTKKFIKE